MPNDYYTMLYTGEKTDELLQRVDEGEIIIPSSTTGSTTSSAACTSTRRVRLPETVQLPTFIPCFTTVVVSISRNP